MDDKTYELPESRSTRVPRRTNTRSPSTNPKATKLRKTAQDIFGDLTASESRVIDGVVTGEVAFCGPSDEDSDPANDPASAQQWTADRKIRSALIRWLCVERESSELLDPAGIHIHAARLSSDFGSNTTLDLSNLQIPFPLVLKCCRVECPINLTNAKIRALDLSGSWVCALWGDSLTSEGSVLLRDGFRADSAVHLVGAEVGGDLSCSGGTFLSIRASNAGQLSSPRPALNFPDEDENDALVADGIKVAGNVRLRHKFRAEGAVYLRGARIGGELTCSKGTFSNRGGTALDANGSEIGGVVHIGDYFVAVGEVSVRNAKIGGDLSCSKGSFSNPAGRALNAINSTIQGTVYMRNGFQAEGRVQFLRAQVGGDLVCSGASFRSGSRLSIAHATIKGSLFWRDVNSNDCEFSLVNASVGSLYDDEQSWQILSKLELDGFRYQRIGAGRTDADNRLRWLGLQSQFRSQPYQHLTKLLRDLGDTGGARKVLIGMETARHKAHKLGCCRRFFNWVWYKTTRYGYEPWQAWKPSLVIVVFGWLFFWAGYNPDQIPCGANWIPCGSLQAVLTPTDKDAYTEFVDHKSLPDSYTAFYSGVYSLDTFLPVVNLYQKDKWAPNPARGWFGWSLMFWRWFEILSGYVLAGFALAGFTNLGVRKE